MATKPKVIENVRNAVDGRFETKQFAKAHPKTTTIEHNPLPPIKPKPKSGK